VILWTATKSWLKRSNPAKCRHVSIYFSAPLRSFALSDLFLPVVYITSRGRERLKIIIYFQVFSSTMQQYQDLGFSRFKICYYDVKRGPLSLVSTIEELLGRNSSSSGLEIEITAVGDPPRWLRDIPLSEKVSTNFADKLRSLGRYNSLAYSSRGVFLLFYCAVSLETARKTRT
jgi:hypothetical protein